MTTFGTLLSYLRSDLKDTNSASYRWSDEVLYIYTVDAIRDYSIHFPLRVDRYELTVGDGCYALPNDFVYEIFVECPQDRFLEKRYTRQGITYKTLPNRPWYYYIDGGNLYLMGSPRDEDSVLLTYSCLHSVPTSESDTTFVLTVPDRDLELLRLYVKAQAIGSMRTKGARLDQYKMTGKRNDNPLQPETMSIIEEYDRKIQERKPARVVHLYRTGRVR
jgi:hypothetical protein